MTIPSALSKKSGQQPEVGYGQPCPGASVRRKKARRSRAQGTAWACCLFIGVSLLLGIAISGFVLYRRYIQFVTDLYFFNEGDQVLASKFVDMNSVVCQSYKVTSSSGETSFYLTNGPAQISADLREEITVQNPGLQALEEYDYRAFYLLPGSYIGATACMSVFNERPRAHAEVLFIKGNDNYNSWTGDASCSKCVQHRVRIVPGALCEFGTGVLAQYTIMDADTYYIVITRQKRAEDSRAFRADINMKVIKTVYDTTNVKQKCLNSGSCQLNLTFGADDDVIVDFPFPDETSFDLSTYFYTDCKPRKLFWIIGFGVVPTGLLVLLTLLTCCIRACKSSSKTDPKKQLKKNDCKSSVYIVPEPSTPE